MINKRFYLAFVFPALAFLALSCSAKKSEYLLAPAPAWYSHWLKQDFIDVEKMRGEGYSTLEALEIQASALKAREDDPSIAFDDAVSAARKGYRKGEAGPSGYLPPKEFKNADFILVVDLDETLLAQWYRSYQKGMKYWDLCTGYPDYSYDSGIASSECIKLVPGVDKLFRGVRRIPGNRGIVVFTAKGEKTAGPILDKWKVEGDPVRSWLSGVFTRYHLTRGGKTFAPSKDLRIVDESLEHAVMIDDSPEGVPQAKNLRAFPKYNADRYLAGKIEGEKKEVVKYYESLLKTVLEEMEDSYRFAGKSGITFAKAFYPYSYAATSCLAMIRDTYGLSKKKAADFLRGHPDLCTPEFFGIKAAPPAR